MELNKTSLQKLARDKLADAELLFAHGRHSSAFYLFGYVVEMALKARIAEQFSANTIPDRSLVLKIHTHSIKDLVGIAGLSPKLREERNDADINSNWAIVEQWSPECRYQSVEPSLAAAMRDAVADETNGVFKWITSHW